MLIQLVQEKKHLSRYESRILSNVEKKYDATKQEYERVLKALQKYCICYMG